MTDKEKIINVLEENTEWFDRVQEDLIHEGKFDGIAQEIVNILSGNTVKLREENLSDEDKKSKLVEHTKKLLNSSK